MGMPIYNLEMLLFLAPALIMAVIAQMYVQSAYARGRIVTASMCRCAAARSVLDAAGLKRMNIDSPAGSLTDHYDPRGKVLRLSDENFHGRSLAAVGIAAHEAGHAVQDAVGYLPLVIRNFAVPAASFGSGASMLLLFLGVLFN